MADEDFEKLGMCAKGDRANRFAFCRESPEPHNALREHKIQQIRDVLAKGKQRGTKGSKGKPELKVQNQREEAAEVSQKKEAQGNLTD